MCMDILLPQMFRCFCYVTKILDWIQIAMWSVLAEYLSFSNILTIVSRLPCAFSTTSFMAAVLMWFRREYRGFMNLSSVIDWAQHFAVEIACFSCKFNASSLFFLTDVACGTCFQLFTFLATAITKWINQKSKCNVFFCLLESSSFIVFSLLDQVFSVSFPLAS